VLNRLNLRVEEGAVHALVGPNGAGKSSLAYAIMGLPGYQPDEGEIVFDGERLNGLSVTERARRGLSLAWQEPARFEGLTVRRFMMAAAADKSEHAVRDALQRVALDPDRYMDRAVDEGLSGGERKRIELASIVVMKPRLMITDEPDSGIDVEALTHMFELLDALREEETTVLLVTHSSEVMTHADTATLVCCGRNVEEGPARKIRSYFVDQCIPCPVHDPGLRHAEG
jgi:Fe-S cluster assembly ATP-binding protein